MFVDMLIQGCWNLASGLAVAVASVFLCLSRHVIWLSVDEVGICPRRTVSTPRCDLRA